MRDRSQNSDLLLERLMESTGDCEIENQTKWIEVQNELKQRLIAADDFTWKLPKHESEAAADGNDEKKEVLKYVGGVDVSYCKDDPSLACAALVVLILPTLQVVHQEYSLVRLGVPYIPGFLAFREAPVLLQLLEKVKANSPHFYPQQLIFVDGNGILHPQGFGLACHLGVLADCPTIGIGKNLHHVDGLTLNNVKQLLGAKPDLNLVTLTGSSGIIWGAALRSSPRSMRPMFISTGHRISLDTAITIVQMICRYRIPEPIRQADIRSREYLQKHRHVC
ncbi:hypothetical protein SAY87_000953 [Trapa incisa]|uniref:Endonuclease V n=1 Tax=Trapa incisa TaxID=236973 RepID=A0AAN7GNV2_9MYRT|nr:hypothetical protein SAY87_000953 [Trapa incisa]